MKIKKRTDEYVVEATKKRVFVDRQKPALIINRKGIEDHSTYFGIGFIAWDDIEEITIHELDGVYIGIAPYDLDKFRQHASMIKKIGMFINQKVAIQVPFNIAGANLCEPIVQVFAKLYAYIPIGQEEKLHGFPLEQVLDEFPGLIELEE